MFYFYVTGGNDLLRGECEDKRWGFVNMNVQEKDRLCHTGLAEPEIRLMPKLFNRLLT